MTAVNDVPAFVVGSNQAVQEDAGPQTVATWATGVTAGPPNESGQTLTFTATATTCRAFSAQPRLPPTAR